MRSRERGDEQALALFEGWDTFDALVAVAEEAGAGGLVALDLLTEVSNPGWRERSRMTTLRRFALGSVTTCAARARGGP